MTASAIAVMDFATAVGKGTIPIAVNKDYAMTPGEIIYIGFNPDQEDNGGWFAKDPDGANAKTFKDYIDNATCPPLNIGDTIDLENGDVTTALDHLSTAFDDRNQDWVVFLPVVDTPKFNHEDTIDSFVPIQILEIKKDGDPKYVKGKVLTMAKWPRPCRVGAKWGSWPLPSWCNRSGISAAPLP